jgi:hypothetical protein
MDGYRHLTEPESSDACGVETSEKTQDLGKRLPEFDTGTAYEPSYAAISSPVPDK